MMILALIFSIFLSGAAHAVQFDSRDTQIDLPVLSTPNNAVSPQISVDQNEHVYAVWSDNRGGSPSIYVNTYLPDTGWQPRSIQIPTGFPQAQGAQPGDATSPQICSDNSGHVYVVWVDNRAEKAGTGKKDIFFRYSKDYGFTWYPEFTDERIDSDNPGVGDSIKPMIDCDGNGNVYIVWNDDRNRQGIYDVYFRSLNIEFSSPTDFVTPYQFPETRLNTGVPAGGFSAINPKISTNKNGSVYVVWEDSRIVTGENPIFPGIYFNGSGNHGTTWKTESIRIDRAPIYPTPPVNPVISSDSIGNVYAAWQDSAGRSGPGWAEEFAGDGSYRIYFNRSRNFGQTWDEMDKRIDQLAQRIETRDLAIANNDRGVVSIVWTSNFDAELTKGRPEHFNLYASHSENYGASFLDFEENVRIDPWAIPGLANPAIPVVQIDKLGNTFVAWVDKLGLNYDIYFNFSIDKGRKDTWKTSAIKVDTLSPPGDSTAHVMKIDNVGHVYIAWQDTRYALAKDNFNIFIKRGLLDIESLLISGQRIAESCFIATAAYGSPLNQHVKILTEFRDSYLLTNRPGKWFVSTYYRLSPPVAGFIEDHSYLKSPVRVALYPFVGIAMLFIYTLLWQKVVIAGILLVIVVRVALKSPLIPLNKRSR